MKYANLLPSTKKLKAELARRNFLDFITYTKEDYQVNWHHKLLAEHLEKFARGEIKKLMVFMPPQHGKSEQTSRRLPAYLLGLNPKLRIVGASYSADIAASFNRDVQRIIDSEDYRLAFPNTCLSGRNIKTSAKGSFLRNADIFEVVEHKGSYKSVGVGGSLTGFTSDILIIDDPVKDAVEAQSPTDQARKWDWYTSVALTRQHNEAQQLITMTRWDKNDLCGKILEKMPKGWVVLHLEALRQNVHHPKDPRKQGEALWESRHSKERIMEIADADPRTFDALFQGDPKPSLDRLYCPSFNYGRSVKEVSRNYSLPLHYTVDFNTSPYMTGIAIEMEFVKDDLWNGYNEFWNIKVIKSFPLEAPNNDAQSLGAVLEQEYPEIVDGFFLYGDASGNNNTGIANEAGGTKTKTLFSDLLDGLTMFARHSVQQRIPNTNPRYRSIGKGMLGRRVFLNKLLKGDYPVRFQISPSCTQLLEDLQQCTQDANGKLAKPKDKEGVEQRGHMLQAFEYFVCHFDSLGYLAKIKQ